MENLSISKLRYFQPRILQVGQLARVLEYISAKYADGKWPLINLDRDLADGSHVQNSEANVTQLEQLCVLSDQAISIHYSAAALNEIFVNEGHGYFTLEIDAVNARVVDEVFTYCIDKLGLVEVESPSERYARLAKNIRPEDTLPGLIKRIETLESALLDPGTKITCFLSFQFSSENAVVAQQVKNFLTTLEVEVTTGESYEPRQVSDKVHSILNQNPDMVVLLVLADGESMWTRDEIVTARDRGASVIPIVQKGAHFTPGIFGDLEWIPFEAGYISETYLKLAEAVRFVRRNKLEKRLTRLS